MTKRKQTVIKDITTIYKLTDKELPFIQMTKNGNENNGRKIRMEKLCSDMTEKEDGQPIKL